jgi:HlyD family secretion protein
VLQESEGVVLPGAALLEIGDPRALEVVVDVLTSDAVDIRPGAPVRITRWGGDSALRARVHRVEPSAFTRISALGVEEQRVNVLIDLDEPRERWAALGDGFRVEASIEVWRAADALKVPAGAVFRHDPGWAVFRVRDGRAALQSISLGRRSGTVAEVLGGLEPEEQVVVYPGDNVVDGVRVEDDETKIEAGVGPVAVTLAAAGVCLTVVRPWFRRWGATRGGGLALAARSARTVADFGPGSTIPRAGGMGHLPHPADRRDVVPVDRAEPRAGAAGLARAARSRAARAGALCDGAEDDAGDQAAGGAGGPVNLAAAALALLLAAGCGGSEGSGESQALDATMGMGRVHRHSEMPGMLMLPRTRGHLDSMAAAAAAPIPGLPGPPGSGGGCSPVSGLR